MIPGKMRCFGLPVLPLRRTEHSMKTTLYGYPMDFQAHPERAITSRVGGYGISFWCGPVPDVLV